MARDELCVLTNMCMIENGDRILVQDRRNPDWPGITFPGGHLEKRESLTASVIREVREETGLFIEAPKLCGVKQFSPPDKEYRYLVFFFKTDRFSGELQSSDEGEVFWIRREELKNYVTAEGFEEMLKVFDDDALSEDYCWFEENEWHTRLC